ncbi:MAG: DUF4830 domain-containing protein [Firmicutes bacterium]|nr:DUF4830 domain-containing protein [Bacillota bacterium]
MFVYSFRASTLKFVGVVLLSTVLLIGLLTLIPSHAPTAASLMYSGVSKINFSKVKTNEDRIAFLSQFGWTVDSTPVEEKEVTIPDEFDRVFTAYNDLQKQQGLDLSRYRRKKVMRYTYSITNYPDYNGTVYANVLVYRNNVIGGDVCSADVNGFIKGFDGIVSIP